MSIPLPPTADDRLGWAIRALILEQCPGLTFSATWEYAVTSTNADGTINGEPTDPSSPVPALNNVSWGTLAAGGVSQPAIGARFLVDFLDADGSRYAAVSVDPGVVTATIDAGESIAIGPSAATPILLGPVRAKSTARLGDSVQLYFPVGLLNGTLVTGSGPVPVVAVPCSIITPVPGVVTSGNGQVTL
jgi:hypothetical protein